MDMFTSHACRLPLLRDTTYCDLPTDLQKHNHRSLGERQQTAPDGQVLPEWLTWSPYETTIYGVVVQTGEILQLPLTYYGPSIPLGPDWTYGGITSPPPGPVSTSISETPQPIATTTTPTSDFPSQSSLSAEPAPSTIDPTTATPTTLETSTVPDALQTGAGPLGSLPPRPASSISAASPSIIGQSPTSSPTLAPSSTTSISTTTEPAPSPSQSESSTSHLLPLLPAILVPLLVAIILILLLIYCFRRRNKSQKGYTNAIGASSGGFGGWLTSSFARRANGSGESFTSAWTPVPETQPVKKEVSPVSADNWQKSNERSALLGFIPNHHRTSSSIDVTRPQVAEVPDEVKKKEEDLEVMADRNQSLLKRLNLGLGWLSVASLVSSKGSGSKSRIASGFTLEKGNGGNGALGTPEETGTIDSSEKTGSADKSGGRGTTSASASAGAGGLSNEQLFYRPPHDSTSSRGSTPSTRGSPRKGFFSRFARTNTSSKRSKRSSGPSRKSWMSYDVVPEEGEAIREGSEGMSVGVPLTLSTVDGDKRRSSGMQRWDSRERLRFPFPPGAAERESLISSNNTEYHSAESNYSVSSAPVSDPGRRPTISLVPSPYPSHQPFDKDQENFARPALSPFGSSESFSPAQVSRSSNSHSSDDKIKLGDLFTASPGRPSIDSDVARDGNRRSFVGQPMMDDSLLQAMRGGAIYKGLGEIDEFGQTVRAVSGEAPTVVNPSKWSRSQMSEIASFHSGTSHVSSTSSGAHSGQGEERLMDNEVLIKKDQALRGRRSQPQLIPLYRAGFSLNDVNASKK